MIYQISQIAMTVWNYILLASVIFYALMVITSVYTVLFERRNPTRALIWIVVIVVIPIVGLVFFVFFGQSYRKRKIFNLRELRNLRQVKLISQGQIDNISALHHCDIPHLEVIKLLLNNSKSPLTTNNKLTVLNDGKKAFPSIFAALRAARNHIHLEYYIIESDELGNELADILCEKARSGVEVRLMYDDVGSWSLSKKYLKRLRASGVKIGSFMPVFFPYFTSKANYRNHRKIAVIDGEIGFMGGMNIANRYLHGSKNGTWRDTHLKIEGEATRMLQLIFTTDWYACCKESLTNVEQYFPNVVHRDSYLPCQIALSGPDSDYAAIMQAFLAVISRAKHYVYISTPYFIPGEAMLTALKVVALSGVDVRILLPQKSDSKIVHWASRSYFTELLEAGINVYLYKPGFNHSKTMVVDGTFCSIGSANMDERSFEDNFEITAMIYDSAIAQQMESSFLVDVQNSELITLEGWENRRRKDNFKESAARLFSPLL